MTKLICTIILLLPLCAWGQNQFTVSGFIEDASSRERLIGANIVTAKMQGVVSNKYGFYSLTLPAGDHDLTTRYMGYKSLSKHIRLNADTTINFLLPLGLEIEEVEVKGKKLSEANPELSSLSYFNLDMQKIDRAPIVFGERDVLKTLQFQPGIKSAQENTAGFNVRGGSSDQNLILLDGVPVYNVNHLMGFFSVFNSDAIKDVSMYKGGIPARYGGRLSSVLDISMKEGNMKKSHGVFSISPISARMTYEAPIKKDTAAFIVSLRRTMLDIPMVLYQKAIGLENTYGYKFYDFNAKANWIINPKNRIYLSVYAGDDTQFSNDNRAKVNTRYRYTWGNITSVLRWNNQLSKKIFSNTSVYYSKYRLNNHILSKEEEKETEFQASSEIQDFSLVADFDYYLSPNSTLRFGAKATRMFFAPNIVQMVHNDSETRLNEEQKNSSNHMEAFFEDNLRLNRFNLNVGLRGVGYDTGSKTYWNLEPRAALRYQAVDGFAANISFTGMTQFIHLLSNSSLGLPTDLWVASTDEVKPQKSKQFSIGTEKNYSNYSFGVEAYYKWMSDVIRFEEGAVFLSTQDAKWHEWISVGKGKAYGAEFFAKKNYGKFTGILSYTLAWSKRQFDDVNGGKWFPHKYDRRHDLSLLGEYSILNNQNREKTFSFAFTLQSGNNISMPDLEYEGMYILGMEEHGLGKQEWPKSRQSYDNPNNFKMPTFHHLDFGYNTTRKLKNGKTYTWSFSVYNVYSRLNPWYYYKNEKGQVKQVAIFPVVPSIGFKYTF